VKYSYTAEDRYIDFKTPYKLFGGLANTLGFFTQILFNASAMAKRSFWHDHLTLYLLEQNKYLMSISSIAILIIIRF